RPAQPRAGLGPRSDRGAAGDPRQGPLAVQPGGQPQGAGGGGALRVRPGNDQDETRGRGAVLPAQPAGGPALSVAEDVAEDLLRLLRLIERRAGIDDPEVRD